LCVCIVINDLEERIFPTCSHASIVVDGGFTVEFGMGSCVSLRRGHQIMNHNVKELCDVILSTSHNSF
jgi:hypothetical protein